MITSHLMCANFFMIKMLSIAVSQSMQDSVTNIQKQKLYVIQNQSPGGVLSKRCSLKFCKIHRKTPVPESLFIQVAGGACNIIKNDALAQVFSCEFCKISKNAFFTEHLWWLLFRKLGADFQSQAFTVVFLNWCSLKFCNTRAVFNKAVSPFLQSIYSCCFWIFATANTFFS